MLTNSKTYNVIGDEPHWIISCRDDNIVMSHEALYEACSSTVSINDWLSSCTEERISAELLAPLIKMVKKEIGHSRALYVCASGEWKVDAWGVCDISPLRKRWCPSTSSSRGRCSPGTTWTSYTAAFSSGLSSQRYRQCLCRSPIRIRIQPHTHTTHTRTNIKRYSWVSVVNGFALR